MPGDALNFLSLHHHQVPRVCKSRLFSEGRVCSFDKLAATGLGEERDRVGLSLTKLPGSGNRCQASDSSLPFQLQFRPPQQRGKVQPIAPSNCSSAPGPAHSPFCVSCALLSSCLSLSFSILPFPPPLPFSHPFWISESILFDNHPTRLYSFTQRALSLFYSRRPPTPPLPPPYIRRILHAHRLALF